MIGYETPGVHYELVDASSRGIRGIRTDVAGFVGMCERGPIAVPLPIESWRQFVAHFGGFIGGGYLAYAVRGFFENGGRRCWVVRVASREPRGGAAPANAEARRVDAGGSGPAVWRIAASSPGVWGNRLAVRLAETHRFQTVGELSEDFPNATTVASTDGFQRGTLVRLFQPPATTLLRVVSGVAPIDRRLIWLMERREARLPYDRSLEGLDPSMPVQIESIEYTLTVTEAGLPLAVYEELAPIPEHPRYAPAFLAPYRADFDFETDGTLPAAPRPIVVQELRTLYGAIDPVDGWGAGVGHHDGGLPVRPSSITVTPDDVPTSATFALSGGADGLALLGASDFVGEPRAIGENDAERAWKRRGIQAIAAVGEVAIVAVPDIHIQPIAPPDLVRPPRCVPDPCLPPPRTPQPADPPPPPLPELPPVLSEADVFRVQADLVRMCEERGDRIALLEAPVSVVANASLGLAAVRAWRARFDSKFAAFYHPWVRVVDPLRSPGRLTRDLPPSGHVAGQYARSDLTVGVHKAPANAPIGWAQDVTATIGDEEHGVLNTNGVNVIRPLPGRGLRILGARTLSGDPSWRFVNVRRLMLMIMKAVDLSTQWVVFEPNDAVTRSKVRLALTSYLAALWQEGAFSGDTPEEAFFVKCDEENNPPRARELGHFTAEIGVAPSYPYEFVVVRVWRAGGELEFAEATSTLRGFP